MGHCPRVAPVLILLLLPPGCRSPQDERPEQVLRRVDRQEWQRRDPRQWLLPLLEHESSAVRARACLAAGRIGLAGDALLEQLLLLLADPDAGVRRQAAFALQLVLTGTPEPGREELGRKVAPWLLRRLPREQEAECRRGLLRSLGAVAGPGQRDVARVLADAVSRPTERAAALEALADWGHRGGRLSASQVRPLDRVLQTEAAGLAALVAAVAVGHDDTELLAALLQAAGAPEADLQLKRWAIRAVARSASTPARVDWLVQRVGEHRPEIQVEAVRALARAGPAGAARLSRRMRRMWRSVSANHYRLTGAPLQPILAGLDALTPHAATPPVRELAGERWELADASAAAVSYRAKEAHAVDLVHCAAARLLDLGHGKLKHTPGCGTARSEWLSGARRRIYEVEVVARLRGPVQLVRYLRDRAPEVRAAAARALARVRSGGPALVAALRVALDDGDVAVVAEAAAVAAGLEPASAVDLVPAIERQLRRVDPLRDPGTACELARAVGALSSRPRALPLLASLLRAPVAGLRRCALAALGHGPGRRWVTGQPPFPYPAGKLPRRAKVVTNRGMFFLQLAVDEAPGAVSRLLVKGRYRDARVVRLVRGRTLVLAPRGTCAPIPGEQSPGPVVAGTVGLVLPAGGDSGQCELLIALQRMPWLDGRLTRVAQVEPGGLDVLWRMQPGDRVTGVYALRPAGK